MKHFTCCAIAAALTLCAPALPQSSEGTRDPFPRQITADEGLILVKFREWATLPDIPGQTEAPRPMYLLNESGTGRLFVNDMRGPLYIISHDGKRVRTYLDINAPEWKIQVQFQGEERGFQSFAFHPQFNRPGTPGYGKLYTYTDTRNTERAADFKPAGAGHTHDTILLEWTAKTPAAAVYDGGPPRELMRVHQPFGNHNGGHMAFNPLSTPRDSDYGLLYFGVADGGSGGDPYNMAQNLRLAFGKILRIDPLGSDSANGRYGIPPSNPSIQASSGALGEIYAYGIRNVQRMFWDAKTRRMFMSDIGQNAVEEISEVTPGANLGWNVWEGSFRYAGAGRVTTQNPRSDPTMIYPLVEYDHTDPLLLRGVAVVGGFVYRHRAFPPLMDKLLFSDFPSGEMFYVNADSLPAGGQDPIRRVLFDDNGTPKTLLQIIQETNRKRGKRPAERADLRFGEGPDGRIYILNKQDNVIRLLVPDSK